MSKIELPKQARSTIKIILIMAGVGLLQAAAGLFELRHLNGNMETLERDAIVAQKAGLPVITSPGTALDAATQMRSSAQLAIVVGVLAVVLAAIVAPLARRAFPVARFGAWILAIGVFGITAISLLQDGSRGVQPYLDPGHIQAQQDLVNSLIVWPAFPFVIYPTEAVGIILPFVLGVKLLQEPVIEFFRQRKKVTTDRSWDVAEILAKRGADRDLQ